MAVAVASSLQLSSPVYSTRDSWSDSLAPFMTSKLEKRLSSASDASDITLNAVNAANKTGLAKSVTSETSTIPTTGRPALHAQHHKLDAPSNTPAIQDPLHMQHTFQSSAPALTYPMGSNFSPQYFANHSLSGPMHMTPYFNPSVSSVGMPAYFQPSRLQQSVSASHTPPLSSVPAFTTSTPQLTQFPQAAPRPHYIPPNAVPTDMSTLPPLSYSNVRPRAASDNVKSNQRPPLNTTRSGSFSSGVTVPAGARMAVSPVSSANYSVDEDDDRPLSSLRGSSPSSRTSSVDKKPASLFSASNTSDRSVTPTPTSDNAPRSSMSTARGVPASVSQNPQHPSPSQFSTQCHRSAPNLASNRPSPLSRQQSAEDLSSSAHSAEVKAKGFGKFKKAFTINTQGASSSSMSSLASSPMKGHEKGRASVTSNTSSFSSSTSTSPPRTPPDPAFIHPHIYQMPEAQSSMTTLPSERSETPIGGKKKRSLFNSKMNSSTDNISISSTVSSASMMIRKIGALGGKLTKRGSLGSIGSMFHKDKERNPSDTQSEINVGGSFGSKLKKKDRKKSSLSDAGVSHVYAEQEQFSEGSTLTPAKALVQKQQLKYAEQEAAAARASEEQERERKTSNDKRLKAIEKEKEKLKGRRIKKWGLGSFGGNSSISYATNRIDHSSQEDLSEFGESVDKQEPAFSHREHSLSSSTTSTRVPVPHYLDDSASIKENLSFGDSTTKLFDERWSSSAENVASYFEDDSASAKGLDDTASEYEGSMYDGSQRLKTTRSPYKPVKGILKASRSMTNLAGLTHSGSDHERVRANSYDTPDHFTVQDVNGSGQVTLPVLVKSTSPYRHPSLNVSAPILQPQAHAPYLAKRSETAPPSKRLTFAPNLSVHTTWPAAVYDRRSEPATCNKLTPILAQRIKEELNAYKLNEMNVHATSRIYTHFFA